MAGGRAGRGFLLRPVRPIIVRPHRGQAPITFSGTTGLTDSVVVALGKTLTIDGAAGLTDSTAKAASIIQGGTVALTDAWFQSLSAEGKASYDTTGTLNPTLQSAPDNDLIAGATPITLATNYTAAFDNTWATATSTDPPDVNTNVTIWFKWNVDFTSTADFTLGPISNSTDPYFTGTMHIYLGVPNSSSTPVTSGSTCTLSVTSGDVYYIAVVPGANGTYPVTGNTPYSYGPAFISINITAPVDVTGPPDNSATITPSSFPTTPASAVVSCGNLAMNEGITTTATVKYLTTTLNTAIVPPGGNVDIAVIIPTLAVGSYALTVTTDSPASSQTVNFIVTGADATDPTPPTPPTPSIPVATWFFTDGTTSYAWALGPDQAQMPMPQKSLTFQYTTSVHGKALAFEGSVQPQSWQLEGWILDQSHHDQLKSFYDLHRRVILGDYLGRQFAVYVTAFNVTPQIRDSATPYIMRYTMQLICYYQLP